MIVKPKSLIVSIEFNNVNPNGKNVVAINCNLFFLFFENC